MAFLAIVPWPGCSLIYNQNINGIVSSSAGEGAMTNFIKPTLSLGWGNHLATDKEFQDAQMGGCVHVHTHSQS